MVEIHLSSIFTRVGNLLVKLFCFEIQCERLMREMDSLYVVSMKKNMSFAR